MPIDDKFTKMLFEKLESFAEQTLRTLLIGFKKGGSVYDSQEQAFDKLTVLAMVGIKDPIRDEIVRAV